MYKINSNEINKNKGITLIALVVTMVVKYDNVTS